MNIFLGHFAIRGSSWVSVKRNKPIAVSGSRYGCAEQSGLAIQGTVLA